MKGWNSRSVEPNTAPDVYVRSTNHIIYRSSPLISSKCIVAISWRRIRLWSLLRSVVSTVGLLSILRVIYRWGRGLNCVGLASVMPRRSIKIVWLSVWVVIESWEVSLFWLILRLLCVKIVPRHRLPYRAVLYKVERRLIMKPGRWVEPNSDRKLKKSSSLHNNYRSWVDLVLCRKRSRIARRSISWS